MFVSFIELFIKRNITLSIQVNIIIKYYTSSDR